MLKVSWIAGCLVILAAVAIGCSSAPTNQSESQTLPSTLSTVAVSPAAGSLFPTALEDTVKFKQEDGSEAFSLKPKEDGAKLVDGTETELVRLTVQVNKVKIKNADDEVLGYVVTDETKWKLENPEQSQELFLLRRQADGDYKLESGTDEPIYRIKQREYGYELESPDQQSLYKVKLKDGKLSLRDVGDRTVLSTRDDLQPLAMTAFGFDVMSLEQQAAIAYAIHLVGE